MVDDTVASPEKQSVKLTRPVLSGDGIDNKTAELHFREPRGKDVMSLGSPMTFKTDADGNVSPEINTAVCGKYISVLASIPPSSVADLSAPDFLACSALVISYFQ